MTDISKSSRLNLNTDHSKRAKIRQDDGKKDHQNKVNNKIPLIPRKTQKSIEIPKKYAHFADTTIKDYQTLLVVLYCEAVDSEINSESNQKTKDPLIYVKEMITFSSQQRHENKQQGLKCLIDILIEGRLIERLEKDKVDENIKNIDLVKSMILNFIKDCLNCKFIGTKSLTDLLPLLSAKNEIKSNQKEKNMKNSLRNSIVFTILYQLRSKPTFSLILHFISKNSLSFLVPLNLKKILISSDDWLFKKRIIECLIRVEWTYVVDYIKCLMAYCKDKGIDLYYDENKDHIIKNNKNIKKNKYRFEFNSLSKRDSILISELNKQIILKEKENLETLTFKAGVEDLPLLVEKKMDKEIFRVLKTNPDLKCLNEENLNSLVTYSVENNPKILIAILNCLTDWNSVSITVSCLENVEIKHSREKKTKKTDYDSIDTTNSNKLFYFVAGNRKVPGLENIVKGIFD